MTLEMEKRAEENQVLIRAAVNREKIKRIPLVFSVSNYLMSYANMTYEEALNDYDRFLETGVKRFTDFTQADAFLLYPTFLDILVGKRVLGYSRMFVSGDGVSLQNMEGKSMPDEDYPEFIKNPLKYLTEKFLSFDYHELSVEKLLDYQKQLGGSFVKQARGRTFLAEECGVGVFFEGGQRFIKDPCDQMLAVIRGLKKFLLDMRRHPKELKEAIEAYGEALAFSFPEPEGKLPPAPYMFAPTMAPNFMSHKQFHEFFAPDYEKIVMKYINKGQKLYMTLQGDWSQHMEWFKELPKDMVILSNDKQDICDLKKQVGDHAILIGGLTSPEMKNADPSVAINNLKRVIDICAPGGGFLLGTTTAASPGDVNPQTFKAINEFVREYSADRS